VEASAFVTLSDGVVTLRAWSREDALFLAEASADPAIRRYNGQHDSLGNPVPAPSLAEAEEEIEGFASRWQAFRASRNPSGVAYAITDAGSGSVAGCCGVDDWSYEHNAQIGYWLAPGARGRGYATRAVVLLTQWLFDLGAGRVFLTVVAGNESSLAVARRAGFVLEGTMRSHSVWRGETFDVLLFGALRHEWRVRARDPVTPLV
jgi:RimJ/RimL family protein N-acetyltransferase